MSEAASAADARRRGSIPRAHIGLALATALALLAPAPATAAERDVRVGIWPNRPMAFIDDEGRAQGVYVDVLSDVAREEGWRLLYVPGTFAEGLARLDAEAIDLMLGIAHSEERARRWGFSSETLLSNWGQLYVPRRSPIRSLLDLAGGTVAVLEGDIYYEQLRGLMARFDLGCAFAEVDSFQEVLRLVEQGTVDAGLVSRLAGAELERGREVERSAVVCCPVELRFAGPRVTRQPLLDRLDVHLRAAKADHTSAYYRSLDHWIGPQPTRTSIPSWVSAAAGAFVAFVLLLAAKALLFRHRLRLRTAELDRKKAELEREAGERRRVAGLLRQAQKMEALGRLAGGIAHDFNNQLSVITGYCDLLAEDVRHQDTARQRVERIARAARSASQLTRSLLTMGRRQLLRPQVVSLNRLVEELVEPLGRLLRDDIRVDLDLAADAGCVRVDPVQVEQALFNLATNARDAMPAGGTLSISTRRADLDQAFVDQHPEATLGPHVVLTVADTGGGIPPEILPRVFEPFFSTKSAGQGTGLGLALVYGFVRQSGGFVDVRSPPGEGTHIAIFLPRVGDAEATKARGAREPTPVPMAPSARPWSVLLVDDDPVVRELISTLLGREGAMVHEAASATEALAFAEADPEGVDVLVTDVALGDLPGPDLARRLRAGRPALRVLFVTGHAVGSLDLSGLEGRAQTVLAKPFEATALVAAYRSLLI